MLNTDIKGKYLVIGPPGCGKTHYLCDRAERYTEMGRNILTCSLTRTAATEIRKRAMDKNKQNTGTMHSIAYQLMGRPELIDYNIWNSDNPDLAVNHFKMNEDEIFTGLQDSGGSMGDQMLSQLELHRHRLTCHIMPPSLKAFADRYREWKEDNQVIDFTDMIERGIGYNIKTERNIDLVLADELQDFSALEMMLLNRWADVAGTMIGAGDGWQNLFRWRGADPTIFDDVDDSHRGVLGQSYRVPQVIHTMAMEWICQLSDWKPIEYRPTPERGEVNRLENNYNNPSQIIKLCRENELQGKTTMILATCGYMLKPIIRELRAAGIFFSNPWRPGEGEWNPIRSWGHTTREKILCLLNIAWTIRDLILFTQLFPADLFLHRGGRKYLDSVESETDEEYTSYPWSELPTETLKINSLIDFQRLLYRRDKKQIIAWINEHVKKDKVQLVDYYLRAWLNNTEKYLVDKPLVYIGTIHSVKGGEADDVVLSPDLSYKFARTWFGNERDDIIRMFYVAMTRARRNLYIAGNAGAFGVKL